LPVPSTILAFRMTSESIGVSLCGPLDVSPYIATAWRRGEGGDGAVALKT
jgi:hypothetical protein